MDKKPDSVNFKDWLKVADEDFGFASACFADQQDKYYTQICFFFQQAVEKYLKAYIIAKGLEFKKIHELSTLLQTCQKDDSTFGRFRQDCDFLTEFYSEARYPVILPVSIISKKMVQKAQKIAKKIGELIKKKLKI